MTDPVGEMLAEPWLVELCHANGCTCNRIEVTRYAHQDDDDDPIPDDWWHEDGCPLDLEIGLVLLTAGIDPDRHAIAFAVIQTLDVDDVHAAQVERFYCQRQAGPDEEVTRLHVALLDWREAQLLARGAS